ncbi:hypothetical protein JCM8547_008516 [Rhodosporidiobolus lusitaniae]
MQSAPPTPLQARPLNRTRRRSSSFSHSPSASSSDAFSAIGRRGVRPDEKRAKRTRGSDSPLKQLQQNDDLGTSFWTQPSPFTTTLAPSPFSGSTTPFSPSAPASTAASLFSANARDFSLPSTSTDASRRWQPRERNASSESTSFWPSTSSLSSSPRASFEDSSFSSSGSLYQSDSSPPHCLPSTSTSPFSSVFTFSCTAPRLNTAIPPVLRCASPTSMLCGGGDTTPSPRTEVLADDVVEEAEALHRVAFDQLRHSTRAGEESFVERMRRWEAERDAQAQENNVEMLAGDESDEEEEADGNDSGDEVELTLELGPSCDARSPPAVSNVELDELSRRLRAGACELEDFSLVREVQARARRRGGSRPAPLEAQA